MIIGTQQKLGVGPGGPTHAAYPNRVSASGARVYMFAVHICAVLRQETCRFLSFNSKAVYLSCPVV